MKQRGREIHASPGLMEQSLSKAPVPKGPVLLWTRVAWILLLAALPAARHRSHTVVSLADSIVKESP
jgi:hypothetical protein